MTSAKSRLPSFSAALAGIPAGLQVSGPWSGRRQLFVKFASEAETATIYTSQALHGELTRLAQRSPYHSVAIIGGDALAESEFLAAAFAEPGSLPVMIDHDGQRPEVLETLLRTFAMVQVTMDGTERTTAVEQICRTIGLAAAGQVEHAVAIHPGESLSDGPLLRIVEQIHEASETAQIVIHPVVERPPERDRRWVLWLEQAMKVHSDVRILPRWPDAGAR